MRIAISKLFVLLLFSFLLFTNSFWETTRYRIVPESLYPLGVFLVGIGTLGRVWGSLYIAGRKRSELVTEGPYSICRNPLYFFSLVGALGIGFTTQTLLVPLIILMAFSLYYPLVIKKEEIQMARLHGAMFETYRQKVPRFIPKFSLFHESESYVVHVELFRRHIASALWFVWLTGISAFVESLHDMGWLPVYFRIYWRFTTAGDGGTCGLMHHLGIMSRLLLREPFLLSAF
jgi:protein-S-isoprenylcysteine O-methyltransferase Ste14